MSWSSRWVYFVRPRRPKFLTCKAYGQKWCLHLNHLAQQQGSIKALVLVCVSAGPCMTGLRGAEWRRGSSNSICPGHRNVALPTCMTFGRMVLSYWSSPVGAE